MLHALKYQFGVKCSIVFITVCLMNTHRHSKWLHAWWYLYWWFRSLVAALLIAILVCGVFGSASLTEHVGQKTWVVRDGTNGAFWYWYEFDSLIHTTRGTNCRTCNIKIKNIYVYCHLELLERKYYWYVSHRSAQDKYRQSLFLSSGDECQPVCCSLTMLTE